MVLEMSHGNIKNLADTTTTDVSEMLGTQLLNMWRSQSENSVKTEQQEPMQSNLEIRLVLALRVVVRYLLFGLALLYCYTW
ncbi:MAG: hypothetical protein KME12_25320 [Trichocoleus desertorum ATA4-8-CV12]|nr:hypothetical protein [Trichocoleus desertorum ATA4-8-CV12]